MFDKFKQSIEGARDALREHATSLGDAAKSKGNALIEEWISTLPKLEAQGLKTTFFSVTLSINPTLDVEMQGVAAAFGKERIQELLASSKGNTPLNLVYSSMKSARQLHENARLDLIDPLTVRIKVKFSPEIRVSYGIPICE